MLVTVEIEDGKIDLLYCPHDNSNLTMIGFSNGEIQIRDTETLEQVLFKYQPEYEIRRIKQIKWIQSHEAGILFACVETSTQTVTYAQAFTFDLENDMAMVLSGDHMQLNTNSWSLEGMHESWHR